MTPGIGAINRATATEAFSRYIRISFLSFNSADDVDPAHNAALAGRDRVPNGCRQQDAGQSHVKRLHEFVGLIAGRELNRRKQLRHGDPEPRYRFVDAVLGGPPESNDHD